MLLLPAPCHRFFSLRAYYFSRYFFIRAMPLRDAVAAADAMPPFSPLIARRCYATPRLIRLMLILHAYDMLR